jgi:hypothetical protein
MNLKIKTKDPKIVLVKPAIKKDVPNSFFPKLQAVTKIPTNVKIAPKTQVSKALYHFILIDNLF